MVDIRGPLAQLGFDHISMDVAGRYSIADLFPNEEERCGIYVLHFEDGEVYVGQSIDVVKRHAQHRLTFPDIVHVSFMPVSTNDLAAQEENVIRVVEGLGNHLRNKQIVAFSYGVTDLGALIPAESLARWSSDFACEFEVAERTEDSTQRRKYASEMAKLQQLPYSEDAISVGRAFVQLTVPAPEVTEVKFWTCTRPSRSKRIHFRVNVGAQQTLAIGIEDDGTPFYNFYFPELYASVVFPDLDRFPEEPAVIFGDINAPEYFVIFRGGQKAGGFRKQVVVQADSPEMALDLVWSADFALAFRKFHVGLMQKGPNLWQQNHIYDLADRLLEL